MPLLTSELGTYRRLFDEKYAELEELLTDLPAEALLWRPFAVSPWKGEAGSLGWLLAHGISSTVYLLKRAEWDAGAYRVGRGGRRPGQGGVRPCRP